MNYSASIAGKITYQSAAAPSSYVGEVDALRCLEMTAVVLQHCQLLPFGWTGVWLFFVISGFAITSSLLGTGRLKHSKPGLIRNFYLRRCLRIWPVYFLVVACNIIAATSLGKGEVTSALPWLATFTYNYRMILNGETWPANGHLWTISVEEQFLAGEGRLCSLCRLPFLQQIGLISYGSLYTMPRCSCCPPLSSASLVRRP
jgi:peptidoglycan/LPS O-acetylase OafA/YrhL